MTEPIPHPGADEFKARHPEYPLIGGPGGPYDGNMEQRVTKLEFQVSRVLEDTASLKSDMSSVKDQLSSIKEQLARMDAKLDNKIDYKWLTVYVLGIVAVIMRNEIASLLTGSSG